MIMRACLFVLFLKLCRLPTGILAKVPALATNLLVANLEGDFTFKDVERFFFPAVNVGRRTTARPHDGLKHGVSPVCFITRCQEAVDIADDGNCLAFARLTNRWRMCHVGHVLL